MVKLISTNGQIQYGISEFAIDSPEDLKDMPLKCDMGSAAICINTGTVYMKNSNGEWKEI